jgi:hypothetical protein
LLKVATGRAENYAMSDLSRLLDDVYEPAAEDDERGWTSDEALDDAFSGWVPGPSEDASQAEKSLFAEAKAASVDTDSASASSNQVTVADPVASDPPSDETESAPEVSRADAIEQEHGATVDAVDQWTTSDAVAPGVEPTPVLATWRPEDDDILPKLATSRRLLNLNLSFRR